MKCSNCGQKIRSKHQCAYCGQVFSRSSEPEAIVPKTRPKRKGRALGVLSGILKLVLTLLFLFLAFLYAPKAIEKVMNYLNPDQVQQSAQVAETSKSQEVASKESTEKSALRLANQQVDTAQYPVVSVKMTFDQPLTEVSQGTMSFNLKSAGAQQPLTHYSLVKDDKTLTLRFNDVVNITNPTATESTLEVSAPSLNFTESIVYQAPKVAPSEDVKMSFSQAGQALTTEASKVAVAYTDGELAMPLYSSTESFEASSMLSWFILHRVYEAVEAGTVSMDTEVKVENALKAENDEGVIATLTEEDVVTVESLVNAMVQQQDVSAMNHLIQVVGGPNEFNQWLKQKDYFATELTSMLKLDTSGSITGASTNALDITKLLTALSQDKLVNTERDAAIKEVLLQTPVSEKYPADLMGVVRRFELTTPDTDNRNQHYAGILLTESKTYIVVVLADEVKAANEFVSAVAESVRTIMRDLAGLEIGEVSEEEPAQSWEEPVYYEEPTYYEQPEGTTGE